VHATPGLRGPAHTPSAVTWRGSLPRPCTSPILNDIVAAIIILLIGWIAGGIIGRMAQSGGIQEKRGDYSIADPGVLLILVLKQAAIGMHNIINDILPAEIRRDSCLVAIEELPLAAGLDLGVTAEKDPRRDGLAVRSHVACVGHNGIRTRRNCNQSDHADQKRCAENFCDTFHRNHLCVWIWRRDEPTSPDHVSA